MRDEELFTKKMRKETSKIHNISDAMINAKLAFALSNDQIWAEGLLVFYEIFKYLEGALDRLSHTIIGDLDIPGIRRVEAFEKDLSFYFGTSWNKNYHPRPSVRKYIDYLDQLEKRDHRLLMAYIYHLYMGLLSGGQILKKKRSVLQKFSFTNTPNVMGGLAVVTIPGNVSKIKKEMADAMNNIAEQLDEPLKEELLVESKRVFELNNEVVSTIETNTILLFKIMKWLIIAFILSIMVNTVYSYMK